MPAKFHISPRAKQDLQQIWNYTVETWGDAQADNYVRALYQRFQWLADNPSLGKHRTDIHADYYSFPQGQHLVFYLINNNNISIIAVPHRDMDIGSYFHSATT